MIGVVITSYGDRSLWEPKYSRAERSVRSQDHDDFLCLQRHFDDAEGLSLGMLRNSVAYEAINAGVEHLVFLDADDELSPGYLTAMAKCGEDIVQPATLGIRSDGVEDPSPVLLAEKPLIDGNFIVIGAKISVAKFIEVYGFMNQPIYEDWDLWLRMWNAGATIGKCPEAIYRVHVNENGRNSNASIQKEWYNRIRNDNMQGWKLRGSNV